MRHAHLEDKQVDSWARANRERSDVLDAADDAGVEVYVVGERPPVMAQLQDPSWRHSHDPGPDAPDPVQRQRDGQQLLRQPNEPSARDVWKAHGRDIYCARVRTLLISCRS